MQACSAPSCSPLPTAGARSRLDGIDPELVVPFLVSDCRKLTICAIHGTAFGGGCEIAMACHYRIVLASTKIAHPGAELGTVSGARGNQRQPRLAGVAKAIEMCTRGNAIEATEPLQLGTAVRVIEGDLLKGALDFSYHHSRSSPTISAVVPFFRKNTVTVFCSAPEALILAAI